MEQLPQIFLADHALYLETGSFLFIINPDARKLFFSFIEDSHLIPLHHFHKTDTVESLVDQLKQTLLHGISRKQADEWRRRWFRAYAFRGQL